MWLINFYTFLMRINYPICLLKSSCFVVWELFVTILDLPINFWNHFKNSCTLANYKSEVNLHIRISGMIQKLAKWRDLYVNWRSVANIFKVQVQKVIIAMSFKCDTGSLKIQEIIVLKYLLNAWERCELNLEKCMGKFLWMK